MNVIGAGFGRTGTTSLKAALEVLGFGPAYHLTEVFKNPGHVRFWEAARRGERVDWQAFFSGYGVAVDWPACSFYAELTEAFPDAVVILTVRDPERWYESTRSTIYAVQGLSTGPPPARVLFALAGLFAPGVAGVVRLADLLVWEDTFGGRFGDKAHAVETFKRRNKEVGRRVPQEKLLVYDVKEGWGPLCDFLGVKEPNLPFPHLNDTRQMRRRLLGLAAASAAVPVLAAAGVLAALSLARLRLRRAGSRARFPARPL